MFFGLVRHSIEIKGKSDLIIDENFKEKTTMFMNKLKYIASKNMFIDEFTRELKHITIEKSMKQF